MKLKERQGRLSLPVKDNLPLSTGEEPMDNSHLEKEQILRLLALSREELSEEQKRCVTLFYLEKKSYQEVADITGYSVMQVKSYIQNGKRNLRILLDKKLNKVC
jgi:RNA polymerase sigma-70 factor (ECF subfamily)